MSEEKGKRLGDLFSLDGSRIARSEEEYRRLLRLQEGERAFINAVLNIPGPGDSLLKPIPVLPEQPQ
jgi:hypothetical protein